MVQKYKILLDKMYTRLHVILGENGDKHWPAKVLDVLETKYHLLPKDLLRLRYVLRRRSFGRSNIYSIFIYDSASAYERKISIRNYHDLYEYPDLLLYKGDILNDGAVHLAKVRNSEVNSSAN